MYVCPCNASTEEDLIRAAEKLADFIRNADDIGNAIEIVFHEIHKDDVSHRLCGSCTSHIRTMIVDMELRPEFERHASLKEADEICDHCATCDGKCGVTFDFAPLR